MPDTERSFSGQPHILLINPPMEGQDSQRGKISYIKAADVQFFPPMNLLYLAAYLQQRRPSVSVSIADYVVDDYSAARFRSLIIGKKPFLVGITCFSISLPFVYEMLKIVREIDPAIKTILGGPHPILFPRETLKQPFVDMVCQGEGERALVDVVDRVLAGEAATGIDNIWTKDESGIIPPEKCGEVAFEDLDEAPFPDHQILGVTRYFHPFLYRGKGVITLLTSRGCPFQCTFCNTARRKTRMRSIPNIIEELRLLLEKFGCRNVHILDDTFNISAKRLRAFSQALLDENIDISWSFRGRISGMDAESLTLARKAGLAHIAIGIEDFTDEGLTIIRKGTTTAKIREIFRICNVSHIRTTANFIIGFPHNQQRQKQLQLIDFIRELSPTTIQLAVLLLMPGSQLYDEAVQKGIITGKEWLDYANNPREGFVLPGWEGDMTIDEQRELFSIINNAFYRRPAYLLGSLLQIRSWRELAIKFKIGLSLLLKYS